MSLTTDSLVNQGGLPAAPASARRAVLPLAMQSLPAEQWDQTIADFDGICQEQLHAFAAARWPGARHEPQLFLLDGNVVGGTLMMIQDLPLRLGAIAVSKWGPMIRHADAPEAEAVYAGMIEALVEEYARRRGLMFSVLPHASTSEGNSQYEHLIARGFRRGSSLLFPNRYIVDLRLSDEAQRRSFHQKWRYHLNKSEKVGLSFEHAGAERAGDFDRLYAAMSDRKQFPDHSAYHTVPALLAIPDPALRPELFFVRHEGELVAGAIIFKAGERAVYLYGATNDKALPLRAGYFMHWNIIRWLRDNTRARWYDLGGTDGFQGLHQFKKGMVGEAGVIQPVPPVANYASRPLAYWLGAGAFAARDGYYHLRRMVDGLRADRAKPDQSRPEGER